LSPTEREAASEAGKAMSLTEALLYAVACTDNPV
jgi:hypothetical protein